MAYVEIQDCIKAIFKDQTDEKPTIAEITITIDSLPIEYLITYIALLENEHQIKLDRTNGSLMLNKLSIADDAYVERHSSEVDANTLLKLEKLLSTEPGKLYDVYTDTILPNDLVDDFVLFKAKENMERYGNEFIDVYELAKLAVELNRISDLDKHLESFLRLKEDFFDTNTPSVDVASFFKLSIPLLRRFSVRRGPEAFQEIRSLLIRELVQLKITPEQLGIDILNRRSGMRSRPPEIYDYHGFELY